MEIKRIFLLLTVAVTLCYSEEVSTTEDSSTTDKLVNSSSTTTTVKTTSAKGKGLPQIRTGERPNVSDDQIEMVLKDRRYLQRQLKCTLGEAPCDPVGRRIKTLAPLVLRGSCPQCTPQEMRQIQKVLSHIQRNFPKEWTKVVRSYQ